MLNFFICVVFNCMNKSVFIFHSFCSFFFRQSSANFGILRQCVFSSLEKLQAHAHTHTHILTYTHTYTYTHTHIHTFTHTHTHTHTLLHTHTQTQTQTHKHTRKNGREHSCIHMKLGLLVLPNNQYFSLKVSFPSYIILKGLYCEYLLELSHQDSRIDVSC